MRRSAPFLANFWLLGVIAMAYGDKASAIKLKCAMSGAAQTGVAADIAFIHSITREVAYDLLLFEQRRQLHLQIASWFEAMGYPLSLGGRLIELRQT